MRYALVQKIGEMLSVSTCKTCFDANNNKLLRIISSDMTLIGVIKTQFESRQTEVDHITYAISIKPDQPVHLLSLVRVFVPNRIFKIRTLCK